MRTTSLWFCALSLTCWALCARAKQGSISVTNAGLNVAKFNVDYDKDGTRVHTRSGNFVTGQTKTITIPDGAKDLNLKVKNYYFVNTVHTVFTKKFPEPVDKCYKLTGTVTSTDYAEVECSDGFLSKLFAKKEKD